MPSTRTYTRSFAGGEISPEMFGRIDDIKYQTGAATLRNMLTKPQGPAYNRPGFKHVHPAKATGYRERLIPFTFSTTQSLVLGLGPNPSDVVTNSGYMRIYSNGAPVMAPAIGTIADYKAPSRIRFDEGAPYYVNWSNHGLNIDDPVVFTSFTNNTGLTAGPLPAGITANTVYYATQVSTNTFGLRTKPINGSVVTWASVPTTDTARPNSIFVGASDWINIPSHNYDNGQRIKFAASAANHIPAELTLGTVYYIVNRTTNTFQLSTTENGSPILFSDPAGGAQTITTQVYPIVTAYYGYARGNLVKHYGSLSLTNSSFDGATDKITAPSHGLAAGQQLQFVAAQANALPAQISQALVYYVVNPTLNDFQIATTANGNFLPFDNPVGSGSVLAKKLPLRAFYFRKDQGASYSEPFYSSVGQTFTADWYGQPFTGEYEVPTPWYGLTAIDGVFGLKYVQSNDIITVVSKYYPVHEIRRYGDTNWTVSPVSFSASLTPPTNVAVTETSGVGVGLGYLANLTTSSDEFNQGFAYVFTNVDHYFKTGDSVYFRVKSNSYTFEPLNDQFFIASWDSLAPTQLRLKDQRTGSFDILEDDCRVLTRASDDVIITRFSMPNNTRIRLLASGSTAVPPTWSGANPVSVDVYVRNKQTNTDAGTVANWPYQYELWTAATGGTRITWVDVGGFNGTNSNITFNVFNTKYALKVYINNDPSDEYNFIVQFAARRFGVVSSYKVTAVGQDLTESLASSVVTSQNNLFVTGAKNTITWTAVTGAIRYNVYKEQSGLYGYIGQSEGTQFTDDNIAPDMGTTPPIYDTIFSSTQNYPDAVTYFEQRRCFAGTILQPQSIWMTKSATERDMSYSLPTKDNDRIFFQVAARESNSIRHMVPMPDLIALTNSAEWRVTSVNQDALTPYSISVRPQSYIGSSSVQPITVNNVVIYAAARGGHVRELGYNWQNSGYVTGDLSLRAPHLFDDYEITDMAYQKSPVATLWFVSNNGKMLSFTYVPEEQIGAWQQHDTLGTFETCCVIPEGEEDYLYVVVNRGTEAAPIRHVERMASRNFTLLADGFFVDSGKTYSGVATTTITGLDHLNGKVVSILADGKVHPQQTVANGTVTLNYAASKVHVGLPYTSDLKTLPMVLQTESFGQGVVKNINKAWLRVHRSCPFKIGPSETKLVSSDPYMAVASMVDGPVDVMLSPTWDWDGSMLIRQTDPVPLNVISTSVEVAIGGA